MIEQAQPSMHQSPDPRSTIGQNVTIIERQIEAWPDPSSSNV
jgi:hypothetical protein